MRIRFTVATLVASIVVTLASAQTVRWKVAPEYNSITCISPSLLLAEKNGLYGLLGTDGRLIASCKYDIITPVVEDRCLLLPVNGRLQAISDASGNAVKQFGPKEDWYVDTDYPYYSEGLLAVCNKRGKWTYMDKTGLPISNPEFKGAAPFLNGYAVVRYKDNSYMHINKRGAISKLDNQFKDNYLSFASSFTPERSNNNGETLVAVIVDSGNNVFLRDRSGKKIGNLGNVTDWDKFDRKMTTDNCVILFEANRQIRSITPKNKSVSKTYSPQTVELYRPPVCALTSGESDGKCKLLHEGRELLPERFDKLTILTATEIIAGQNGHFGVLVIDNGYSPRLEITQKDLTFEHHIPAVVSATIHVDPEVEEGKYHIVVRNKEKILSDGAPKSGSVSFDYLPEDLSESGTEYFNVSTDIDRIAHPEYSFPLSISYKNRFIVKLSEHVKLNKANTAGTVTLTISNEAASESDLCDILVNGITVRKGVRFKSNESLSIPVSVSVDIQDLDNVSRNVSIQVKEIGCPVYKVTPKVIFERNL